MLSSFLKIAIRNLLTRKGFAFLNILGLVNGMTSYSSFGAMHYT
jgi:hypothetical protein